MGMRLEIPIYAILVGVLVALFAGCGDCRPENSPSKQMTLTLQDGRGCVGTLKRTGGGYAEVGYYFECADGRMFVNLSNAELK